MSHQEDVRYLGCPWTGKARGGGARLGITVTEARGRGRQSSQDPGCERHNAMAQQVCGTECGHGSASLPTYAILSTTTTAAPAAACHRAHHKPNEEHGFLRQLPTGALSTRCGRLFHANSQHQSRCEEGTADTMSGKEARTGRRSLPFGLSDLLFFFLPGRPASKAP